MIEVVRAAHGGFCMGVALALRKLDAVVAQHSGRQVATLGDIIHNPQVIEEYARKGVRCLQSVDEAEKGMSVLIRAHGVPRDIEAELRRRCTSVEDATCPRVKKAQLAIAETASLGRELFLYGEADHPEVRGLISYSAAPGHIFSALGELEILLAQKNFKARTVVLAAQTTQDRLMFSKIKERLSLCFGERLTVLDTICDATRQRQEEVAELSRRVQIMTVVGGRSSGNTRRLADLARMHGGPAILVETADELDPADFRGMHIVGLTAGASTPKSIIDEVERRLRSF